MRRTVSVLTLISALLVVLVVGPNFVKATPRTIVVPDDYPTIKRTEKRQSACALVYARVLSIYGGV